ncbi:MAG: helix-turn-helix transcriptional regulator [Propionibacteriales bacterium]|nr:helix-turn-helix transcriptional regulator [Propionibacteriales bacterium]
MPELSKRENEIMRLVARGLTNAEIAAELFISPITVRNHVSSILAKLHVTNRTQAVVKYRSDPPPTQGRVDGSA